MRVIACVRRFKCVNARCVQSTFSEQISGLTTPFARRTPPLTDALVEIALELAGRPGSRLAAKLAMPCCRDVLIRLIRAQPIPEAGRIEVLGVDDFAVRRRQSYKTILIDMATHRPVDVLPDREADTLAAWLREHPEIQVVCRDRAGAYANGIAAGAPGAIQVADRLHLWKNLCEAAGKTVTAHHGCLRPTPEPQQHVENIEVLAPAPPIAEPVAATAPERRLVTRTRQRFEAVQGRLAAGMSRSAISRELNLDIQTVRRFANATGLDELLVNCQNRITNLDGFIGQVDELWNAGLNGAQITERIRQSGFTGSERSVRHHLRPYRIPGTSRSHPDPVRRKPAPSTPPIPKPRTISRWILTRPDHLGEDDSAELKELLTRCEHLDRLNDHVRGFAAIMTGLRGDEITRWLENVEADDLPELRSFATGIRRDLPAVINGLTLRHSSGAVEGNVTRIKRIKRDGYGRAKFDLLRAQILLAA